MSPGLLQLTAVRHQRRTTSTPAVGAERCRPHRSQAPVGVTTSHQCYGSCTGCQSVSASCSRSRGSYISRGGLAPAYLADDCRLLSDVGRRHCGPSPMTCGSCLCHEHITNSVIGVSRPPVLDYGTTFHLDSGGRDLPSTLSDNL